MAVKKRADYKHLGQVGHFKIAYKWTTNKGQKVLDSIVVLNGRNEVATGLKNVAEARKRATELMSDHQKLRKNKV